MTLLNISKSDIPPYIIVHSVLPYDSSICDNFKIPPKTTIKNTTTKTKTRKNTKKPK